MGSDRSAWPELGPWLRAVMVMGVDGAIAGADGRSGSLSNPRDRAWLQAVRAGADAILIGASTFRAERYRPLRLTDPVRTRREASGKAPSPRLVIVSASLELPWEEAAFAESEQTPLVVTGPGHSAGALGRATCEVAVLERIDAASLIALLHGLGLERIDCEGGRVLLSALAEHVDQWDLTLAPMAANRHLSLRSQAQEDGYLYLQYLREGG